MPGEPAFPIETTPAALTESVPVKLGANGIEQIYEVKLQADEKQALDKSASAVKELIDVIKQKVGA